MTDRWLVRITDAHPTFGGATEVWRAGTQLEAIAYGQREVKAALDVGITATFTVSPSAKSFTFSDLLAR